MHIVRDIQLRLLRQKSSIKSTIVLTDWRVKVRELVETQAYHMAQWFQFCTNNWIWKNYRQNGCRICSMWTISVTVWRFQNNVWRYFNVIQMNFCADSLLWTKYGSLFHPRRRNSQNNRLHQVNQLRRRRTVKSAGKMMATVFWDAHV